MKFSRLGRPAAQAAVTVYAARAVFQLVTLGRQDLTYDFGESWLAARALNHGTDPYAIFLNSCPVHFCPTGYVYLPLYAEILRPLALLPLPVAAGIWLVLSHAAVIATILVVNAIVRDWLSPSTRGWLLAGALLFFPLLQALYFVQVIPVLSLGLALAAWAYVRGREGAAGGILGLLGVLRLTPLVMGPIFLVRRAQLRRPAGLLTMIAVVAVLVGGLWLATSATAEYVHQVAPRLAAGSAELDNQAPLGLYLRAQALGSWPLPLPPVLFATLTSGAVLGVTWLLSLGAGSSRRLALVFAAFLAAAPLLGSLTEPYHYTTELLVFALAAASLLPRSPEWWLALVGYPLLWMDGHITNPLALALGLAGPTGWRVVPFLVVTGTNLVGAVLLWLACLVALRRQAD